MYLKVRTTIYRFVNYYNVHGETYIYTRLYVPHFPSYIHHTNYMYIRDREYVPAPTFPLYIDHTN